jgi:hypothetical protein
MSISIRGTFDRPATDTVWAMYIFATGLIANIDALDATGKVQTLIKGDPVTDLELVVDHYIEDEAWFAANTSSVYQHLPLWITPDNKTEVEAYQTANGITVTLKEVSNPDLTGYTPIRDIPWHG